MRGGRVGSLLIGALAAILASCTSAPSPPGLPKDRHGTGRGRAPATTTTPSSVSARGKPNIVVLLSDDQALNLFDRRLMPNVFGQLVDQGVNFRRAYVNLPLCCPSRASILTGLYAHHTGVQQNGDPLDGTTPERPTFPQALHDAGYRTMLDGKYLNSESCAPQPGWDRWVCGREGSRELGLFNQRNPVLNVDGRKSRYRGYQTDLLARFAVDFINESRDPNHPFFLYFAPRTPHLPGDDPRYSTLRVPPFRPPSFDAQPHQDSLPEWVRTPPLPAGRRAQMRKNLVKMTQLIPPLDDAIGTILDAIRDRARDTVVLYLTDNGYMYGQHRLGGKAVPYEESIRIPFVIRYPKIVQPDQGFSTDALVENVDVAPTLMDLARIPWEADGRSLLPLLERRSSSVRDAVLTEFCQADPEARGCNGQDPHQVPPLWSMDTARYTYTEYATGERELYDLRMDPYQLRNLGAGRGHAALRRRLAAELRSLRSPPRFPDTTIATGPVGSVAASSVSFTFFSQDRATTFSCQLLREGEPPTSAACNTGRVSFASLAAGPYRFRVRAMDSAGMADPTPAERSFTVGT